jgi:hypothetical protein
MALTQPITLIDNFDEAIPFDSSYIKISSISGNKDGITILIDIFKDKGGRLLERREFYFTPLLNEENFIKQAYEHLKALSEFSASVDC